MGIHFRGGGLQALTLTHFLFGCGVASWYASTITPTRAMHSVIRIAAAALVCSSPVWAQTMDHAHMDMSGKQHTTASPAAQKEIATVEAAVRPLGNETAAASQGFRP